MNLPLAGRRASRAASVFQDPRAHTNPLRTVGDFLTEGLRRNQGLPKSASRDRACQLLHAVGVEDPRGRMASYPHELSGGLLQRVMIAGALSAEPRLLLADEPTTALDTVTQAEVMAILAGLRQRLGLAMLFITRISSSRPPPATGPRSCAPARSWRCSPRRAP